MGSLTVLPVLQTLKVSLVTLHCKRRTSRITRWLVKHESKLLYSLSLSLSATRTFSLPAVTYFTRNTMTHHGLVSERQTYCSLLLTQPYHISHEIRPTFRGEQMLF